MFRIFTVLMILGLIVMPGYAKELLIVHDEWETIEDFAGYLEKEAGYNVTQTVEKDFPEELKKFDAIIMYIHGGMTSKCAQGLIAYAENGGRLLVLHHGIASNKNKTPEWLKFLGIHLNREEGTENYYEWIEEITSNFVNLHPNHYITSHNVTYDKKVSYTSSDTPSLPGEFPALELHETEVYINHQFTDGREKTVLFGFRYEDAKTGKVIMQDRSGWYKPVKKGLLFYLQPGHSKTDFANPNFAQIVRNCLTWTP